MPSKSELASGIAKLLWSRLSIARLTDETGHRGIEQVVRVASASHAQIVAWHTDLRKFGDIICQHAIDFRGDQLAADHHRRLFDQIKNQVLADGVIPLAPRSFIDFRFADLDPKFAKHWHKAYFVDTYSTIKITVQHRISTQLHDVRNPVLRAIDETKYPVPQRYCDLFHSFPDWISESVRVLEGDQTVTFTYG